VTATTVATFEDAQLLRDLAAPDETEIAVLDAWWRANNYLTIGQIYLQGNPLLREPLTTAHIKPRLLGTGGPVRACR